jgi:hypothetical protein
MRLGITLMLLAALVLSGCGGPYYRQEAGDANGVPVQIEVTLTRDFVRDLQNRGPMSRETVIYSRGFYSGWHGGYGHPGYCPPGYRYRYDPFWHSNVYWTGPAPTMVYLLGGDGPSQGRLLRTELDYGTNIIDVRIRPGRVVTLTVQAYGGLEGWEAVATFTAAQTAGQRVVVDVKEHPPQVIITNPDGTTLLSPAPVGPPKPMEPTQPNPPAVPVNPAPSVQE